MCSITGVWNYCDFNDNCDDDDDADVFQAMETDEHKRLVYKFQNTRASSVRTIMIARYERDSNSSIPSRQHVANSGDGNYMPCDSNDTIPSRQHVAHSSDGNYMPRDSKLDTVSSHQHVAHTSDGNYSTRHHSYVSKDQLLIFTKGSRTYTPHQVGIKRLPRSVIELLAEQHADVESDDDADYDEVDTTVEMHGHIIGMNLSPDHRSVYIGF